MKPCEACGNPIDPDRLDILPHTTLCVQCTDSRQPTYKAFMVYGHKTAGEIAFVKTQNAESLRIAERANARKR